MISPREQWVNVAPCRISQALLINETENNNCRQKETERTPLDVKIRQMIIALIEILL
jgi:hypothetical protein